MGNIKETRTCIGCRQKNNKHDLIRLVNVNKEIIIDHKQKEQGRGFYICKNEKCLKRAMKNKKLKINNCEEQYQKIRGVLFDK